MNDRIEQWRTFVAVASLRSFSGAARRLGRSPQAVTRAVAALEARLATRLLHRTTRAVSLTDDGERHLERARRAVAELDALEAHTAEVAPRGTVHVTAPVLFGQLHVVPVVADFLAAHPAASVRLTLLDRVVSLAEEGIDLAVRIGDLPDSALRARRLGQVRAVLVASPAYLARAGAPRTARALARHACITFTGTAPSLDRWTVGRAVIAVEPRLIVNTAQAAIDAARAGLGIARVLSYQVDALVAAGELRVLLPRLEPPPVPVHLVALPGPAARVTSAFADAATAALRARLR